MNLFKVNDLIHSNSRLYMKVFFYLLFAATCFAQCYSILRDFFSYPTMIDLHDASPSLMTVLPGITICNNNRMSLRKLLQRNITLRRAFESRFPNWSMTNRIVIDERESRGFRDELAELFDQVNFDPTESAGNSTMSDWFDLRPSSESFIRWLGCTQTWDSSFDCSRMTRIESVTSRRCTTILHRGALIYDAVNRPIIFNESRRINDHTDVAEAKHLNSLAYYDSKEVLKLVLNFEPEDYGDLRRQVGGRVSFHSNDRVASSNELDFFVTKGYQYDFSIERKEAKLLNKPYDTCYDYRGENSHRYASKFEPRIPLSQDTCWQNCMLRNTIRRYKCWLQSLPYFRNDSLDPNSTIKACNWHRSRQHLGVIHEISRIEALRNQLKNQRNGTNGTGVDNAAPASIESSELEFKRWRDNQKRMNFYNKIKRFCFEHCWRSCLITDYVVSVTRSVWPADLKVVFDESGHEKERRHCCAMISLRFNRFHYSVSQFKPKNQLIDTIGDLGGLLAFWLGFSIVSIYHVLHKLVRVCSGLLIRLLSEKKQRATSKNNV